MASLLCLLPPANEVCENYVFTCVCLSGGGCLPPPRDQRQTPPRQTPPPLGRHPQCMLEHTPHSCPVHAAIQPPHPTSACWDTVNKQAIRISLECTLVSNERTIRANYPNQGNLSWSLSIKIAITVIKMKFIDRPFYYIMFSPALTNLDHFPKHSFTLLNCTLGSTLK